MERFVIVFIFILVGTFLHGVKLHPVKPYFFVWAGHMKASFSRKLYLFEIFKHNILLKRY